MSLTVNNNFPETKVTSTNLEAAPPVLDDLAADFVAKAQAFEQALKDFVAGKGSLAHLMSLGSDAQAAFEALTGQDGTDQDTDVANTWESISGGLFDKIMQDCAAGDIKAVQNDVYGFQTSGNTKFNTIIGKLEEPNSGFFVDPTGN